MKITPPSTENIPQEKQSTKQKIMPTLWFDYQAEEAAIFYTSLFKNSTIGSITRYPGTGTEIHGQPDGKVMTVNFELEGYRFIALNGGPHFKFNPSISFFVTCRNEEEIDSIWNQLIQNGTTLMPLDTYEWSNKYGWLQDQYGVSWQLYLDDPKKVGQKICPSLMFVGDQHGKAEEAIRTYNNIFPNSGIMGIMRYEEHEEEQTGTVKHAQFNLNGEQFMAMDSSLEHKFVFNETISFLIECDSQSEIDYYWKKLSAVKETERCGWLKDQFGISWQIVPRILQEMILEKNVEKVKKVTKAFLNMKKLDIQKLKEAFEDTSQNSADL